MSNRLDQEREALLQPERMSTCIKTLVDMGFDVVQIDHTQLEFKFKGNVIKLYPYSGWFTGKGVGSDRGFNKLLKRLNDENS
jgi:hypothetical protein